MQCEQLDSPATLEFFERVSAAQSKARMPLAGTFELTSRCNLRCSHCYLGDDRAAPLKDDLTTQQVKHILDELSEAGCLWLTMTGGEIFLRKDFIEIYRYAKQKGFVLTLYTNGGLISQEVADTLAELPPHLVEISLYGNSQATYERVTGIPGSYMRCMRGIRLLRERGIRLKLKTIAMRSNIHELPAMRSFAAEQGLDFRFDAMIIAELGGGKAPLQERLSPKEVVAADLAEPRRVEEYQETFARLGAQGVNPQRLYSCMAGRSSFHIDAAGRLSPCITARMQSYDLLDGSFEQGWNEFLPSVINQPRTTSSRCESCKLLVLCGQCPGWAALEHGDPNKSVDFLCQVAHLRAKEFVIHA